MEGMENVAMEGDILDLEESSAQHGDNTNQKLVGRVLTEKVLNTVTVRKTIFNMWGDPQGLVITNAGPNSFILNFKSQEEARRAYEGGPWRIEGHMLSLQWWSSNLSIEEVNYNQLSIWVQIHGLPYDKINIKNAERIGAIVGRVISAEDPFVEGNMLRSFLRVRVEINVQAPLKTRFWFKRKDTDHSWAEFKYEKLCDYCYKCGRIGHDRRTCEEELARSLVNSEMPRYGPELSTPGLKSIENEARKAGIRRRKEEQNNWVLNTVTVRKTIFNMWGDPQGLVITNAGPNSFILNFKSQEEARRAYEGGPWRIEGHMLSLQWWSSNLSIEECGRIGHDRRTCEEELARSLVNSEMPRYGPELSTPGLKSIENEARKAGIRRRKEEQNNWVEEFWEACERSMQGREWLKRQAQKNRGESSLGDVRSSQASASAKSWDRSANPQEQMGERQVAIQEEQDQDEGADEDGMNGDKHNNTLRLKDDGTANHKKGKKEEVILQNQLASESVTMGNVNEAREKEKAEENMEDRSKIPRHPKEKGGPGVKKIDNTKRGAWAFTNQRPNRNRQQTRSGPIEEERNITIREILKEFNKNMAEEKRRKSTEKEKKEEAHNRNNMDIDGAIGHYKTNERESVQRGKQIVTKSEGGFYYMELAEEEEEIEQKNSKAIVVARGYEVELVQRMEEKLKLKRRREEDQPEQTAEFEKEEEEARQMGRANKKNR
ncbi:hypothetical protein Ahy_A09g043573 [Arachis hypogaea]|uniref:CCHC-type domain-containing protein n=1 Tax=Arachis hypogaea TaxID=3818 RepID=A0A445BIN3_ARAHY|nr:hypothetical protein Ahy_A09g043573 [Arachis hypogaea]